MITEEELAKLHERYLAERRIEDKIRKALPKLTQRAISALMNVDGENDWPIERIQEALVSGQFHPKFGYVRNCGYDTYLNLCKATGVTPRENNRNRPKFCPHCGKQIEL